MSANDPQRTSGQNFAVLQHGLDQRLAEYRKLATNNRGLFGFDKCLGPQVDFGVMRENSDTGDYDRAQKANDYDF
jgi:hypothetical protein